MFHQGETEQESFYRVANVALSPLRWFLDAVQFLQYLALAVLMLPLFLWLHLSWVIGYGEHGYFTRIAQTRSLTASTYTGAGPSTHVPYVIDFTRRSPGFDWDHYHSKTLADLSFQVPPEITEYRVERETPHPASLRITAPASFPYGFRPNPCEWSYTSTEGYDWDKRVHWWMVRKSDRWRRALVASAFYTASLRETLTELKIGGTPPKAQDPCNADLGSIEKMDRATFTHWQQISSSIFLEDAPVVKVQEARGLIIGVCIVDACDDSLMHPIVTWFGDMFDTPPDISPAGEEAEHVLYRTSTDDFWLLEAHRNHIYGHDTFIVNQARQARTMESSVMAEEDTESKDGTIMREYTTPESLF